VSALPGSISNGRLNVCGVYPSSRREIKRFECGRDFLYVAARSTRAGSKSVLNLLFRRRPVSENRPASPGEMHRGQIDWNYDRAEITADGIVHAVGIVLGLIGAVAIVVVAVRARPIEIAPTFIYIIGLVAMLGLSAAYNMWPISPTKWLLRRFDHSAIYLLIAGTYTPFLVLMKTGLAFATLTIGIWSSAFLGMFLKLALPGRFDRLSIALYLLLGWSGVIAYDHLLPVVPSSSLWLLAIGGILYSLGTLFHAWERLRFQNAIWHGFVLLAASCHYSAVLACLTESS
jgi:hemolysin III